jgi:response regulator NasT
MSPPTHPLRVAVAEDREDDRHLILKLLARLGHEVVAVAQSGRELVEQCRGARTDLVIADVRMPDMDGIQAAAEVNRDRQVPFILVSAYHDDELIFRAGAHDHVMAFLVKPIDQGQLKATLHLAMLRFGHYQALLKEAASLRQALEDRKLIERAKGVVMRRLRVTEEEAFRRMKKLASAGNRKVVEVAQQILHAEEAFRVLEVE